MAACVLCEPFSAHKAYRMGVLTDVVPALKVDGKFVANPLVETQRMVDELRALRLRRAEDRRRAEGRQGAARARHGRPVAARRQGRGAVRQDAAHLPRLHDQDARGAAQAQARRLEPQQGELARLARAQHDDRGARRASPPSTRARKDDREVDFVLLRQKLAAGESWVGPLHDSIQPKAQAQGMMPWPTPRPLKDWLEHDGALLRLRARAAEGEHRRRGDDRRAVGRAASRYRGHPGLRGVLLDAEGPHFSFGASVEEHLPEQLRGDARVAARADPGDARVPGADPGRGARPVPRRRPRGRARRRPDLRRAATRSSASPR